MKNNEINSMVFALVLILFVVGIVIKFLAALAIFGSIIFTIAALIGWNKGLRLDDIFITPQMARAFVVNGVISAVCSILFAIFMRSFFQWHVADENMGFIGWTGYAIGSLSNAWESAKKLKEPEEEAGFEILPPPSHQIPPTSNIPQEPVEPFLYAEWKDEEELRK